jgi:hypothetical protein
MINSIYATSGSEVLGQNKFMIEKLSVHNSSGSSSNLELECRDLDLKASSGAEIKAKGSALNLIAGTSSGSSIRAKELKVIDANLEASSGASIDVHVSGQLVASASSGASIKYYGEATPKSLHQSSGGGIQK